MVSGESEFAYGDKYKHEIYDLEKRFPNDARMMLVNLVLSQCLGDDENKCLKNAGELLIVVDEVLEAIAARAPLTDQNNVLVIPCRFCEGFYQKISGDRNDPLHITLNLVNQTGVQVSSSHYDILQCGICSNVQIFGRNQPFEAMRIRRMARVNAQPTLGRDSKLRW
jgi:hypothetical protein